MPRKARLPLDPVARRLFFFAGDWERLTEILAARRLTPSEFLREYVHRKLRQIESLPKREEEIEVDA